MYASAGDRAKLAGLLEPVRRAGEQSALARELLDTNAIFASPAWTIRHAHRFLKDAHPLEPSGVGVRRPDLGQRVSRLDSSARPPGSKAASFRRHGALLDFNVSLALDGAPLTDAERRQLLEATEGLTLLRGRWVEVDHEQLTEVLAHWQSLEREHAQGIGFIEGMRLLAGARLEAGDGPEERLADWSQVSAGDWLRQTLDQLRRPETIDACRPGRDLQATLRPYQVEGVRWLWFMTELGLGLPGGRHGSGKTIQVIDLLPRASGSMARPLRRPCSLCRRR